MLSQEFIDRLTSAVRVVALTGAGASAESGIATFRDPGGIWEDVDPAELASMSGFLRDPVRVQAWYSARRRKALAAEPHAGLFALAEIEKIVPEFTLVTQNVDGLHRRAGSSKVLGIHGDILDSLCSTCGEECAPLDVSPNAGEPALCPCGGLVRPAVVWFGEMLDRTLLDRASKATTECDVFLSIGTGAEVQPAAALPLIAADHGAYVLEVNPRPTVISSMVSETVRGRAGEVLPAILQSLTVLNNVKSIA